jgi:hypothetical protein
MSPDIQLRLQQEVKDNRQGQDHANRQGQRRQAPAIHLIADSAQHSFTAEILYRRAIYAYGIIHVGYL